MAVLFISETWFAKQITEIRIEQNTLNNKVALKLIKYHKIIIIKYKVALKI